MYVTKYMYFTSTCLCLNVVWREVYVDAHTHAHTTHKIHSFLSLSPHMSAITPHNMAMKTKTCRIFLPSPPKTAAYRTWATSTDENPGLTCKSLRLTSPGQI